MSRIVKTCPFCGGLAEIRSGVNTGSKTIGCENIKCVNSIAYKIPMPGYTDDGLIDLWNKRGEAI